MDGNLYALNQHLAQEEQHEARAEWEEGFREELKSKLVSEPKVNLLGGNYIDYAEVTDALGEEFWAYLQSFHGSLEGGAVRMLAAEKMIEELNKALDIAVDNNLESYADKQADAA